jgi:hypothetical protein
MAAGETSGYRGSVAHADRKLDAQLGGAISIFLISNKTTQASEGAKPRIPIIHHRYQQVINQHSQYNFVIGAEKFYSKDKGPFNLFYCCP